MLLKFCIVSVLLGYSCTSAFFKGKPLVNITRHYPCDDFENEIVIPEGNITSYNKSIQILTGTLKLAVPIDKSYKGGMILYRFVDNKWHKDIVIEKDDPCVTLKLLLGPVYAKLLVAAHAGNCPIGPGTFSVTDYLIDTRSVPLIYATGLFKVDSYLIRKKDKKLLFCYHAEITITLE